MTANAFHEDFATQEDLVAYVVKEFDRLRLFEKLNRVIISSVNRGLCLNLFYSEGDYVPEDVNRMTKLNRGYLQSITDYLEYARSVAERDGLKLVKAFHDRRGRSIYPFRDDDPLNVAGIGDFDITTTERADKFVQMVEREHQKLDSMREQVLKQTRNLG